ncbi:MAG TPA: Hpt domain-containing protein [Pseudomonadales bacterium]|nr:Hpt domain-containing protein [Pseudomonadales bacterium]
MELREDAIRQLRELKDSQGSLLDRVVDIYLEEAVELVGRIDGAVASADLEDLRLAAHTLASSSAQLGADAFSSTCRELERLAAAGDLDAAAPVAARCRDEFTAVAVLVAQLRGTA